MTCRYLTEEDVAKLLTMPIAIAALDEAFRALAEGKAQNIPRRRAKGGGALLHSMSAAAEYLGYAGWKQYVTRRDGARFLFGMHELATGKLVGLFEADRLGQQRTGAATGVALKRLTSCQFSSLTLFGAGWQAEAQLEAAAAVLPHLTDVRVYSRDAEKREAFCKKMSARLQLPLRPVADNASAVRGAEAIITVTSAKEPVFSAEDAKDAKFVAAVGSNWPQKAEVEAALVAQSDVVVCDDIEACQLEAGDLIRAAQAQAFDWSKARNLCEFQSNSPAPEGRVLFKSVGLALEDLAVGAAILPTAERREIGQVLDIQMGP